MYRQPKAVKSMSHVYDINTLSSLWSLKNKHTNGLRFLHGENGPHIPPAFERTVQVIEEKLKLLLGRLQTLEMLRVRRTCHGVADRKGAGVKSFMGRPHWHQCVFICVFMCLDMFLFAGIQYSLS